MRSTIRNLFIAIAVLLIDIATKTMVSGVLQFSHKMPIKILSFFNITSVWNRGISFGLFRSSIMSNYMFLIISILIVLVLMYVLSSSKELYMDLGLTCIIAGAIGNIIDRIRYGAVLDFIDLHLHVSGMDVHFPVFNIADLAISFGACTIIAGSLFEKKEKV